MTNNQQPRKSRKSRKPRKSQKSRKTRNLRQSREPRQPAVHKSLNPIDRPTPRRRPQALRFTPYAWAKLLWFRDRPGNFNTSCSSTEVGGFAITSPEDLLLIEDFITVKQEVTAVSVCFDDESVADFFDRQVDGGRKPQQFARIWCHTHPGDCPNPSVTDEETFARVFGGCDWAVMFILAQRGDTYARLHFSAGPGATTEIPVEIDYTSSFSGVDYEAWEDEYQANIQPVVWELPGLERSSDADAQRDLWLDEDPTIEQHELEMLSWAHDFDPDDFDDESEMIL